jgi:hypothetical protein
MKQFVLEYLGSEADNVDHIAGYAFETRVGDMRIDLENGREVAVYVINRAVRIPEIRDRYERNTAHKIHTLFILDGRMMPDEAEEVEPATWMAALHSVAEGRIYAYWCDRREVTIRPVHMEWKWGGRPRKVEYGPVVEVGNLRARMVECTSKYITGMYATADFGDAAFWKKQIPGEAYKGFKYSWRQWRYTDNEKKEEPQQDWDPWEEFARHYGRVGGSDDGEGRRYQRRQRESLTEYDDSQRHYDLLGVSPTASFDEIKQAYRTKAREYHPDLHPDNKEQYTERMVAINQAFEALSKLFNKSN